MHSMVVTVVLVVVMTSALKGKRWVGRGEGSKLPKLKPLLKGVSSSCSCSSSRCSIRKGVKW